MSYKSQWKSIIRYAEGTDNPEGYQTTFSYGQPIALGSPHPGRVNRSGKYASDASGAYQFLSTTWKDVWGGENRPMTPQNQDEAAVKLMQRRGVDPDRDPLTRENVAKLAPEWASLPTLAGKSYYGQPVKAYDDLMKRANRASEEGANITPQVTPSVTPAATPSVTTPAATKAPKRDDGFMGAALAGIRALGGGGMEESAVKAQFAQGPEFATELNTLGDAILDGGRKGGGQREQAPRADTGGPEMLALAAIRSLGGGAPQTQQEQPAPQLQQTQLQPTQTPAAQLGGVRRVGEIVDHRKDVFATTGDHLDVRVQRPDGSYINPETARSMLTEVKVGGKSLFSQGADGSWTPAAPITSGFGPRPRPAPGASTEHMGTDFAAVAGTPIDYTGAGEITREHGMYVIKRPDGHRLKFLHTI